MEEHLTNRQTETVRALEACNQKTAAFGLTLVGTGAAFCPLLLLCSARNRYFRQTMALLLGLVRSLLQRGKTR